MKKIMSKFGLNKDVKKGNIWSDIKCNYCNFKNTIKITNKLNKSKILVFKCNKCGKINNIGDIYNFTNGKTLNNRLEPFHDTTVNDKHEWSQEYDNI